MTHVRRASDGGFEVRIVVPAGLRSTIGKTNLTRRLGRLSKSDAKRLAAPVIQQLHDLIERAKAGSLDDRSSAPVAVATLPQPSKPSSRQASSPKLMAIFDGYLRERQPSPATIKRWRPVCAYSGARVGEIAQMRGRDIIEVEGIWAMRITPFVLEQAGVPAGRVTYARYAAGHSVLEDEGALTDLSANLHRFVAGLGRR